MDGFLAQDVTSQQLGIFLAAIEAGERPNQIETKHVDAKEEAGRRDPRGRPTPGAPHNEVAAGDLLHEFACMANTPGGGALVIGIADDGARVGADLDAEWLRHRLYERSGRRLTVDLHEHHLRDGTRLLVGRVPQALEPHRINGRIHWRVDDNCVEVDASTWHDMTTLRHHDWSAEDSTLPLDDVDAFAVEVARSLLRQSRTPAGAELAALPPGDLVRRLPGAVTAEGTLTNAGRLLFTTVPPAIDYRHRPMSGADATIQIRRASPLLVQLDRVLDAMEARSNSVSVHVSSLHVQMFPALPLLSAREAIVNGVVHRDWNVPEPTEVEHVRDRLRVTSPGGLVGTVTPANILTHVSTPRHRTLAELTTRLGLTERQGIGVDRMYRQFLQMGRSVPTIIETVGPAVRTDLIGGVPDEAWVGLLADIHPSDLADDLNVLLALDLVVRDGWLDPATLAPVLQDTIAIASDVIGLVGTLTCRGQALIRRVAGQPVREPVAWTTADVVRDRLSDRATAVFTPANREALFLSYASHFGRISTTEASSLASVSTQLVGETLKDLEADGSLAPSRQNRLGAGFHYVLL